jgi:imidazolonepropionase-like amidohydrolase
MDTVAARRAVETLAAAGVTSIKVHDLLSPEMYASIVRAARSAGLPVVGHVPVTMTTDQVIDARQRSIEHLGQHHGPFADCSTNGHIDRETSSRLLTDSLYFAYFFSGAYLAPLLAAFDADRCADLAKRLAEAEVWQVPTLVIWREWSEGVPWIPPGVEVYLRESLPIAMRITVILNDAGVPIMTGTDNVGTIHDELALLVEAGLTPLQALQAATLNPARFVEQLDEMGTIEPGKLADLVLLDANPLDDITNTQKIRAVVANGRLYRRADLDGLLAKLDSAQTGQ